MLGWLLPASHTPARPEGLKCLLPGPLDTHLIDADLLELLLGCCQRGRGGAGRHMLLVAAQGHVLLQADGTGNRDREASGVLLLQGWMHSQA